MRGQRGSVPLGSSSQVYMVETCLSIARARGCRFSQLLAALGDLLFASCHRLPGTPDLLPLLAAPCRSQFLQAFSFLPGRLPGGLPPYLLPLLAPPRLYQFQQYLGLCLAGYPEGSCLNYAMWSPNSKHVSFTTRSPGVSDVVQVKGYASGSTWSPLCSCMYFTVCNARLGAALAGFWVLISAKQHIFFAVSKMDYDWRCILQVWMQQVGRCCTCALSPLYRANVFPCLHAHANAYISSQEQRNTDLHRTHAHRHTKYTHRHCLLTRLELLWSCGSPMLRQAARAACSGILTTASTPSLTSEHRFQAWPVWVATHP